MKKGTIEQFDKLESELDQILKVLGPSKNELMNLQPDPSAWSITQILQHLRVSEKLSRVYLEKKLSYGTDLPGVSLANRLNVFKLFIFLHTPLKFKAPTVVNQKLPPHSDFSEVIDEWKKERAELKKYLLGLPNDTFTRSLYRHPYAGKMSLAGMVQFFRWHQKRHGKQMIRTFQKVSAGS